MGADSKIEWCDHTFNPWVGCTKVSPACDHCYAERWAKRTGHPELWTGARRRTAPATWQQPLKWNAEAPERFGRPARVFCASLADVFDNQVDEAWRADLFALIDKTPNLNWLLLTKRPQNIMKMLPADWGSGYRNVWLGTTIENQHEADRRLPFLLGIPCAKRFVSCEPLLGPVDLTRLDMRALLRDPSEHDPQNYYDALRGRSDIHPIHGAEPDWFPLDWVIAGGESGGDARPSHPDWVRSLRDQCAGAGTAFLFKQWGEFREYDDGSTEITEYNHDSEEGLSHVAVARNPSWITKAGEHVRKLKALPLDTPARLIERLGKKKAGRRLDGIEHNGFPS